MNDLTTEAAGTMTDPAAREIIASVGPRRAIARANQGARRERVALEESNADIEQHLLIGTETVKTHVASLLRKLQLRDRIALVAWAHQHRDNT